MVLFTILGGVFTLLGFIGAVYALASVILLEQFVRLPGAVPAGEYPPVTVLKPLHGSDPSLEASLESFFLQDYPSPIQIVFGVDDHEDPAVAVVEGLRARHPEKDVALVVGQQGQAANPKIANLMGMYASAAHDVLVLSDSDIAVAPDYLRKVVSALAADRVGAVTCLYTGAAAASFASRISAMGISYHFLPNVVTGVSMGLTQPCFGSTIALKKDVLQEIGGFDAFASQLADDNEIGRAVRQHGRKVAIPTFVVRHACTEATLRQWWDHELRWMRTIRTVDHVGHAGSMVTHGFSLAMLGAIFLGLNELALSVAMTNFIARAALKWRIDKAFQGPAGPYWLLPLRDVLSFAVFVTSLFGTSVVWQDARLRVHEDGALSNR